MSESKAKPKLYYYFLSSCSWRVRIALAHKEIEYNLQHVEDPDSDGYRAINPLGQIPVLDVGGQFIAQSMAIVEYLEERYPEKPLLPTDIFQRAKVREISELIVSGIQPLQNPNVAARHSEDPEKQLEWTTFYIHKGLSALEKILNGTSSDGKFCVGDTLTIADCCLAPQAYNAVERFKVDMTPFPKIQQVYKELMKLDAVRLGCPLNFVNA